MTRLIRPLTWLPTSVLMVASLVAGCRKSDAPTPALATPTVILNHDRAPAGSPLEITYKFVVTNDARFDKDYRVMVHVVDTDEELMWTDDHNPPVPTTQWKAGQTVEYARTVFVPIFPYVGDAGIYIGLYSTTDQKRALLHGQDMGQRAYKVGTINLLPQTENLFTVFKEGWHPAEVADSTAAVEWQWTKKEGTLAFKNPKKDAVLYLDVDSPGKALHGPQQVQVTMGGVTLDSFTLQPDETMLRKVALPSARMGSGELTELQVSVDKTFVPVLVSNSNSKDKRELGVRVFHAFVDSR
jgi:hypothetical protein